MAGKVEFKDEVKMCLQLTALTSVLFSSVALMIFSWSEESKLGLFMVCCVLLWGQVSQDWLYNAESSLKVKAE